MKKRIISIVLVIATLFAMSSIAFSANAKNVTKNTVQTQALKDNKKITTQSFWIYINKHNFKGWVKLVEGYRRVKADGGLGLRKGPSTSYKFAYEDANENPYDNAYDNLTHIPNGSWVFVYYKTESDWGYVKYTQGKNTYYGWVYCQYLKYI